VDLVPAVVELLVEVAVDVEDLADVEVELAVDPVAAVSNVTALSASHTFFEIKSATHEPRGCGRGLTADFGLTLVNPSSSCTMKNAFSESPVRPSSMAAMTFGAGSVHLLATCPGFRHRQQSLWSTGIRGF
jgi:hypothetical protein